MAGLLAYRETESLLSRLGDLAGNVVLVGGQAVNFWAERYLGGVAELAAGAPYASKDIDLCGGPADAERIGRRLRATVRLAEPFDPSTNIAVIMAPASDGSSIRIDTA
jgi:hypothetical protein